MQTLTANHLVNKRLGNYSIERLLGQSRLHAVYLARNLQSQRSHALTLYLLPQRFPDDARDRFLVRFLKEAHAVSSLHHSHILPVQDYGEFSGYPYLVTPYMTNGSLADILKQHGRYTPADIQHVLAQLASGLEYAHEQGFVHGTLKPANIVLSTQGSFQLAGFGLMHMLQLCGIEEQPDQPYAHLLSIVSTFLVAPEYVAPEVVQGQAVDVRSDIYAFGCILFELLSGRPPFTGAKPLEVAQQHVQQAIPSLHILCPDLPPTLVSVLNQALARDPERRFQHISELRTAFDDALGVISNAAQPARTTTTLRRDAPAPAYTRDIAPASPSAKKTTRLQETPAAGYATHNWQLMPPIVTGKIAAISGLTGPSKRAALPAPTNPVQPDGDGTNAQKKSIASTGRLPGYNAAMPTLIPAVPSLPTSKAAPTLPPTPLAAPTMPPLSAELQSEDVIPTFPFASPHAEMVRVKPALPDRAEAVTTRVAPPPAPASSSAAFNTISHVDHDSAELAKVYGWWAEPEVSPSAALPPVRLKPARQQAAPEPLHLSNSDWGEGMALPPPARSRKSPPSATNLNSKKPAALPRRRVVAMLAGGIAVAGLGYAAIEVGHMLGAASTQQALQPPAAPAAQPPVQVNNTITTKAAAPRPAAQPQMTTVANTPKQTAGTGTIIGAVSQPPNTAAKFTNPADNNASLLIHLSGNTFVASETACTHEGVTVNYDPATKKLVCPRHGAIFDPANGGKVLQGPATTPILQVKVKVNADGTIATV